MDMLKIDCTYCRVGVPAGKDSTFTYNYIPLVFTEKKIAGSIVVEDDCTFHLTDWEFDGEGPPAAWWLATADYKPQPFLRGSPDETFKIADLTDEEGELTPGAPCLCRARS